MKTSEDIRIGAQLISSIQIDPTTCFNWVTGEISDIALNHFKAGKYTIEKVETAENFEIVTLSNELILLDKVIDSKKRTGTTDFELHNGNELTISIPGKYEIRYYAQPPLPQTKTTPIEMPEQYIDAMKFYISARIRARLFGQADSNAVSFFEEYKNALTNADAAMLQKHRRHRRMPLAYRGF